MERAGGDVGVVDFQCSSLVRNRKGARGSRAIRSVVDPNELEAGGWELPSRHIERHRASGTSDLVACAVVEAIQRSTGKT